MDIGALTALEIASSYTGLSLNMEQRVLLENSLAKLQADNKAKEMRFLGCLLGLDGDYFLAQSVGHDALMDVRFFYSTDGTHWSLLQECNPKLLIAAGKIKGRFTGDPAHDYDPDAGQGDNAEDQSPGTKPFVKEEDRLALVIHELFHEVSLVPRKALLYTPSGAVVRNPSFRGLRSVEGDQLDSYLHLRIPAHEPAKRSAADADLTIDFLEPLGQDQFKASWVINRCFGDRIVVLRNLCWPGSAFYHKLNSTEHGFCYMGIGQKNLDVPFMLPSPEPAPPPGLIVEGICDEGEEEGEEENDEEEEEEEDDREGQEGDEEDGGEKREADGGDTAAGEKREADGGDTAAGEKREAEGGDTAAGEKREAEGGDIAAGDVAESSADASQQPASKKTSGQSVKSSDSAKLATPSGSVSKVKSDDSAKQAKSTESTKQVKSNESTKGVKSNENAKQVKSGDSVKSREGN